MIACLKNLFLATFAIIIITNCADIDKTSGNNANTKAQKSTVIVLGMIHSSHTTSERYSIPFLKDVIRNIDPDYVLTEIPPDRLEQAQTSFAKTGKIDEPRVARFPEYIDALFPLTTELDFKIIPTAGWTTEMAQFRRDALDQISKDPTRANDWATYQEAIRQMDATIGERGDDPIFIHTDTYDAITKKGLTPYATLFANDLGIGDWETINKAHYTLIEAAIDAHAHEGATILITFGAGHKYWFLEKLRDRNDIVLVNPTAILEKLSN